MALQRLVDVLREDYSEADCELFALLFSTLCRRPDDHPPLRPWHLAIGSPPYETPNVVQLLDAYQATRSSCDTYANRLPNALYEIFLTLLDDCHLVKPSLFNALRPCRDKVATADYRLCYVRWFVNCEAPRLLSGALEHRPSAIFGAHYLSLFFAFAGRSWIAVLENVLRHKSLPLERLHFFLDDFRQFVHAFRGALPQTGATLPRSLVDDDLVDGGKLKLLKCARRSQAKQEDEEMSDTLWHAVKAEYERRQRARNPHLLLDSVLELMPRDQLARLEEQNGKLAVYVINNNLRADQERRKLLWLLQLQVVITQQLPKMPLEYVSRVVWDCKHRNIVLVKGGVVIAGMCFRTFPERSFSEIVFCAVVASEQVKGYGTHLMNHLKDYHVRNGIYDLLTYADELAVGYFVKQGFSKRIHVAQERFEGYVKDYEGAAFMACKLYPNVVYTLLSSMVKKCKEIVHVMADFANASSPDDRVYDSPFLNANRASQRVVPLRDIVGVCQSARQESPNAEEEKEDKEETAQLRPDQLKVKLRRLVSRLQAHASAWPFREPVDGQVVTDYYEFIQFPMDLRTLSSRVKEGYYLHAKLFKADVMRMLDNCLRFNHETTKYYKAAVALGNVFHKLWAREEMDAWMAL